jgi:hypothetical protein
MPHTYERYDQFSNFVPANYNRSLANPLNADGTLNPAALTQFNGKPFYLNGISLAGVNGFPRGVVQNKYNTWQPRVGFAYSLTSKQPTVIRGGFGMFFERVQGNDVYNAAQNPPFAYQPSATNVYFSNPHTSALTGATTTQAFPSTLTDISFYYPPPGTAQFSLGIQRQLSQSFIGVIQYVGSVGWTQNNARAINTLPLTDPVVGLAKRQAVATNTTINIPGQAPIVPNANLYRQYPGYSSITQEENKTNFNYNSLQIGVRWENKYGLTFQLAYTYSHEIDTATNDLNTVANPFDISYDRASGGFDRRQIFNANYIYQLPFFTKSGSAFERIVLGGWEVSGVTVVQSGIPQSITYNGADVLGLGGGTTNRPNIVAPIVYPKTRLAWFNKSAFAAPIAPWNGGPNQGFGNARKDAIVLPGLFNFNLAAFKTFSFTENVKLQMRVESFNTFNHTEFQNIDASTNDANFGQVTSAYDPRVLQLGAKISF